MGSITTHRRVYSSLLAVALTAAFLVVLPSTAAHAASPTLLTSENFNTSTVSDPNWKTGGTAFTSCLTASTNTTQSPIAGCAAGAVSLPTGGDPTTSGTLRLTENVGNQVGYALYDVPLPFTKGLQVTFDQYQYNGSGADGIGFFLADGSASTFAPGQPGGSFGYAQRSGLVGTPSGYLGLAVDAYGNFANDSENRGTGCSVAAGEKVSPNSGRVQNSVTLRGPGTGTSKYCWLATSATLNPALRTDGAVRTATGTKQGMRITIDPATNKVTVERNLYDGNGYATVLTTNMPPSPPSTVKFGFLASTGGSTDIHEIDNVSITSLEQLAALHTTIAPAASSYTSGSSGTINIGVDSLASQGAGNAAVKVKSTLPTGVSVASVPTGTGWDCTGSSGQTITCTRTGTVFYTAGTVFPNISVPVTFSSSYSATSLALSDTAYSSDAAPDYGTGTVNVTPVGVDDSTTAVGGVAKAITVLSNDKGSIDPTSVTITSPSANGTAAVNATTGVVTFTSAAGFSGVTSFTYQVKDTSGQATTAVATVTVTPKANADTVSTAVNTAVTTNVLANDFGNFDTTTLTILAGGLAHGSAVVQAGGLIKFTPTTGYSGTDTLTYQIKDTGGTATTAVVSYTITPTAGDDTAITPADTPVTTTVLANDAGSVTTGSVTVTTAPGHGTTSVTAGKIKYTPSSDWSGIDTYVYRVSDGTTQVYATVTVTVTPSAVADSGTINANSTLSTNVLTNDPGALTPGSVTVSTAPGHGTTSVNTTTGVVTYTPTTGWSGTDTYVYTAADGAGQTVSALVTVTVKPTAATDSLTQSVTVGSISISPLTNDVGSLSNSTFAFNGSTVFTTSSWNATTGVLTLTQPGGVGASGTWTQGYKICDTAGTCVTSSFTVTITPVAVADSATTGYITPVGTTVLTNDLGSMTKGNLVVTVAPAHGSTSVNTTTGVITYTPAANWSGVDTYTYRSTDGTTQSSAVVTVTTTPLAAADTATASGVTPVTTSVLTNDKGVLAPATVQITVAPAKGTAVANVDGTVTYTAPANYSGTQTYTYSVADTNGSTTTAVVTVTVNPSAVNDTATTTAGTAVTVDVLANDNATPNVSTEAITTFAHGTRSINPTTGAITYTPAASWSGVDTATVSYKDTAGKSTSSTLTITTTPTASVDAATTGEHTAVSIPVLSNDNGNYIKSTVAVPASGAGHPAHGSTSVNTTTGAITYTPVANFSGVDTFTYTVSDAAGQSIGSTVTVTVTPALANDTATTDSSTPVDTDVLANDHGSLDPLTLTAPATSAQGGAVAIVDGKVRYTPLHTFSGTDTVTYTVKDGANQSGSATLTITVTPKATDDTATTTAAVPVVTTAVLANDDGSLLPGSVVVTVAPAHGTTSVNATTGAITFTATAGWSGKDVLTYKVCDSSAQCTTAKLNITVTPVAGPVTTTTPVNTAVNINPTTGQTGSFDVTTVALGTPPAHGAVTINTTTGVIKYTPSTDWSGDDTFTYTIKDNDGQPLTVTATVGVTPTAVNDTASTAVDQPVDINQLLNDHGAFTSVDAPALFMSTGSTPHGSVTVNPDLSLHYVPTSGYSGTDTITYVARDGAGRTSSAIVTVSILPTAVADSGTSTGHQAVTVDVLANDHGVFVPSTVTVPASGPNAPAHGTVSVSTSTGKVTYTPSANWSGTDVFAYTACDASAQCSTASVSIVTKPDASDDTATTTSQTPVTTTVLGNDHGSFVAGSVTVTSAPSHGTTSVDTVTGKVTYTPAANWSGHDSYGYTASDAESRTASAVVSVTVTPVAVADSASTVVGTAKVVHVLANDHGSFVPATVDVTGDAANGSTTVDVTTGDVTYTPDANWSGDDTFTYEACDAASNCSSAQVSIHVTPVPVADVITTTANHAATSDVTANDTGSVDKATVSVVGAPSNVTATVNATTGAITVDPDHDWSGDDLLVYKVCDTNGSCATASLTIHVTATASADTATTTANHAVTADVLANDHGSLLPGSVTAGAAAHGDVTVDGGDGSLTYTPDNDWSGVDSVVYGVTDGVGVPVNATLTITVTPVATADATTTTADHAVGIDVIGNDHGSLDPASVAVSTPPAHGTTSVDPATGEITYTPYDDWSGDDSFSYGVCDAHPSCTSATVDIVVKPVAVADSDSTPANDDVTVDVVANDRGTVDATTVSVSVAPNHGSTSVDPVTGEITYSPDNNWSGTDTFSYEITDDAGRTATTTVTIETGAVVNDDSASTDANTPVDVDVLGNDHGTFDPASVTVPTGPGNGATSVDPVTGKVTYTPHHNWSGDDSFTYRVCDGTATCLTAHVDVTVAPTATDDSASTSADDAVTVDVLANDAGTLDHTTVTLTDDADHGTTSVDPVNGKVTYTPDPHFSGSDHVTYSVKDAAGRTAAATITIDVGIVAHTDSATTDVDTDVTIDVLANDSGTPLGSSVTIQTGPANGSTTVDPATGEVTYSPDANWSGDDTFTYRACDSAPSCSTATVKVRVLPVADADSTNTGTTAGTPVVVDVLGNDHGSMVPSSVTVPTAPAHGSTDVDPVTGEVTYTPADDWSGDDAFTYRVCDSVPSCVTAQVTVHVDPTSSDDSATTASGHAVVVHVGDNDHGSMDPSTLSIVTPPGDGTTAVDTTAGTVTYTPPAGWSGTTAFRYELCDFAGSCVQADVTVHVAPTATDDHGIFVTGSGQTDVTVDTLANDNGSYGQGAVTITGAPAHGTATVDAAGVITYVPNAGYLGTDVVTYTACDVNSECVSADVTITVEGVSVAASTKCVRDAAYVNYAVSPVAFSAALTQRATVSWIAEDGTVVSTKSNQPMTGSLLWPGTSLDAKGNVVAWPGWTHDTDGTWTQVDDGLRPTLTLRIEAGPSSQVVLSYPRASSHCAAAPHLADGTSNSAAPRGSGAGEDAPTDVAPSGLAHTGSDLVGAAQLASSLLFLGLVLVVVARRRHAGEQ